MKVLLKASCCIAVFFLISSLTLAGEVAPDDVEFVDGAVLVSLTGVSGDPSNGRKVFMNRKLGNCLACHANSEMLEQTFHGEVGPLLDGVASNPSKDHTSKATVTSFTPDSIARSASKSLLIKNPVVTNGICRCKSST